MASSFVKTSLIPGVQSTQVLMGSGNIGVAQNNIFIFGNRRPIADGETTLPIPVPETGYPFYEFYKCYQLPEVYVSDAIALVDYFGKCGFDIGWGYTGSQSYMGSSYVDVVTNAADEQAIIYFNSSASLVQPLVGTGISGTFVDTTQPTITGTFVTAETGTFVIGANTYDSYIVVESADFASIVAGDTITVDFSNSTTLAADPTKTEPFIMNLYYSALAANIPDATTNPNRTIATPNVYFAILPDADNSGIFGPTSEDINLVAPAVVGTTTLSFLSTIDNAYLIPLSNLGNSTLTQEHTTSTTVMTINVAPTVDWQAGDIIKGMTSLATATIVSKLTSLTYVVSSVTGTFQAAEELDLIGNLNKNAIQTGAYPVITENCMAINVQPTAPWETGDLITGQSSGAYCTIVAKLSNTIYSITGLTGTFQAAEEIGVTGNANKLATQTGLFPTFTTDVITINVQPTIPWVENDVIEGATSLATATIASQLSSTVYELSAFTGTFQTAEELDLISNIDNNATQTGLYPTFVVNPVTTASTCVIDSAVINGNNINVNISDVVGTFNITDPITMNLDVSYTLGKFQSELFANKNISLQQLAVPYEISTSADITTNYKAIFDYVAQINQPQYSVNGQAICQAVFARIGITDVQAYNTLPQNVNNWQYEPVFYNYSPKVGEVIISAGNLASAYAMVIGSNINPINPQGAIVINGIPVSNDSTTYTNTMVGNYADMIQKLGWNVIAVNNNLEAYIINPRTGQTTLPGLPTPDTEFFYEYVWQTIDYCRRVEIQYLQSIGIGQIRQTPVNMKRIKGDTYTLMNDIASAGMIKSVPSEQIVVVQDLTNPAGIDVTISIQVTAGLLYAYVTFNVYSSLVTISINK